ERQWLTRTMDDERMAHAAHTHTSVLSSLTNGKVWLLSFAYFLNTLVTYGVFLWLPRILQDASGLKGLRLGLLTAIPFVTALVGMVIIGAHSDRTGERKRHVAACALTGATGLFLTAIFQESVPLLVLSFALSEL